MRRFFSVIPLALVACGGGNADLIVIGGPAFTQESLNDPKNVSAENAVVARLGKQPPSANVAVAIAQTGTAELTGIDLASGKTWTYAHPLERRARIAGPLVVGAGNGEVFALDAKSGAERWKTAKLEGHLVAAGSDGQRTALVLKTDDGQSRLAIVGMDGVVRVDKTTDIPLGAPAVAAGVVFVPWKALYVTAFEADTGAQLATFVTDTETTVVAAFGGALFAGQGRLARFDDGMVKRQPTMLAPPTLPDVSRHDLLVPPDHDDKVEGDALDSTVLVARPAATGPAAFVGDRLYGAYYRLFMGWGSDGKLAWVRTSKDDAIAAGAADDGVVIVDEGGGVSLVAGKDGGTAKTYSFGKRVLNADVTTDGLSIGAGAGAKALVEQIQEAVTLNANQLATGQLYLVQQLATDPDESATKILLSVADGEKTSAAMKDEARKAIAMRTNGAAAMLELLARHASFLTDLRSPPVGPIAKALAAMKEKKAAPLLLEHLLDPNLPQRDLLETAEGVGALATPDQLPQLEKFIALYRGSATGNLALTDACGAIGAAILRVGGDAGAKYVSAMSSDVLTDKDVQSVLQKAIDDVAAAKEKAKLDAKKPDALPKEKTKVEPVKETPKLEEKKP